MPFEMVPELDPRNTVIKVIGVGGGGGSAVNHMITHGAQGIEFIAANTDHQALTKSKAHVIIQLGQTGLGAGAKPEVGAQAAQEAKDKICEALRGTHLLFVTAGMGGGTGTGAAPVIATMAREMGILTVGVVTKPFSFEGSRRMRAAEKGIEAFKDSVDSMIVILNDKLEEECPPDATMLDCFDVCNDVLYKACVGIADMIHTPGQINLDFSDLQTVMGERGSAIMGLASAKGPNRAREAAEKAISSPLIEGTNLQGARGLLVCFTGDRSLTRKEVEEGMEVLGAFTHRDCLTVYGHTVDETLGDELRVTVVATGLAMPGPEGRNPSYVVPDIGMGMPRPIQTPTVSPAFTSSFNKDQPKEDVSTTQIENMPGFVKATVKKPTLTQTNEVPASALVFLEEKLTPDEEPVEETVNKEDNTIISDPEDKDLSWGTVPSFLRKD